MPFLQARNILTVRVFSQANICSGLLWPFHDYCFIVSFLQKAEYESKQVPAVCSKIYSISTSFLMSKLGLCGAGKSC